MNNLIQSAIKSVAEMGTCPYIDDEPREITPF